MLQRHLDRRLRFALRQSTRACCLLAVFVAAAAFATESTGANGALSIPRARTYLAGLLHHEWTRNTITMRKCWRVSGRQVNCNARINGSKANSYCLTTAAAILDTAGHLKARTLAVHCHTPPLPGVQPPPSSALPPEYPGNYGDGHAIAEVGTGTPLLVTLEDGSVWKVEPTEENTARAWNAGDQITLLGNYTRYPNFPDLIDDRTQGTSVAARYVSGG